MDNSWNLRRIVEKLAAALTSARHSLTAALFPARKGAVRSVGQRGKGSRIMTVADASGLPAAACLASTPTHEVKLAETALDSLFIAEKSEKLIGDKVYDSDKLDEDLLKKQGVEMIAPHRRNRTKPRTQDSRKLRRHQRRWKVGRLFAWLQNFRRLVVRYERHADSFFEITQVVTYNIVFSMP